MEGGFRTIAATARRCFLNRKSCHLKVLDTVVDGTIPTSVDDQVQLDTKNLYPKAAGSKSGSQLFGLFQQPIPEECRSG